MKCVIERLRPSPLIDRNLVLAHSVRPTSSLVTFKVKVRTVDDCSLSPLMTVWNMTFNGADLDVSPSYGVPLVYRDPYRLRIRDSIFEVSFHTMGNAIKCRTS